MSNASKNLATVLAFLERVTHWQEGKPDRHDAMLAIKELPDDIEWIEKGLAEWRGVAQGNGKQAQAARATARIAIGHLQATLNESRSAAESWTAETAARDWLESIGSEPGERKPVPEGFVLVPVSATPEILKALGNPWDGANVATWQRVIQAVHGAKAMEGERA